MVGPTGTVGAFEAYKYSLGPFKSESVAQKIAQMLTSNGYG